MLNRVKFWKQREELIEAVDDCHQELSEHIEAKDKERVESALEDLKRLYSAMDVIDVCLSSYTKTRKTQPSYVSQGSYGLDVSRETIGVSHE